MFTPKPSPQRPSILAALALVAAVTLTGCGADSAAPETGHNETHASSPAPSVAAPDSEPESGASSASVSVEVNDSTFSTRDLQVSVGDTVEVINTGDLEHSLTSDAAGIDTGVLGPGETATFTVTTAGTFDFYCTIHPSMTGTLTVS